MKSLDPLQRQPDEFEEPEELLRSFFRAELEEDLPPLPARPAPAFDRPAHKPRRWQLAVASVVVILAAWGVWPPANDPNAERIDELVVTRTSEQLAHSVYETPRGTVVQSTDIEWTTVSRWEATGDRVQWSIPELTIVVSPFVAENDTPHQESTDR